MADRTSYQISMLMKYNRDGSPNQQETRYQELMRGFEHLQTNRGYSKHYDVSKFSRKDINRLVHDWKAQGLKPETIANKLAHWRWLTRKIGRPEVIPESNRAFGLREKTLSEASKAERLDAAALATMPVREQLITELRALFGLRTDEAVKFQHRYATKHPGVIRLKGHWTKGGRPREISIVNDQQRALLARVGQHQKSQEDRSMIPNHRRSKSYYRDYNEIREKAGIPGHGLRHQWAQDRFKAIAGFAAPKAGGPAYETLSRDDQAKWNRAAQVVNQELGHGAGRLDITATYIGTR